ncbi:6-phosphogluconolactonase [Algoriphagus aestuarii]|nr:6-phosphogluconolactonase [Algoriphagus aestuarii]
MKIEYFPDFGSMSQKGAEYVHLEVAKNPSLLFCVASGGSPSGLYELMHQKHENHPGFFNRMRVIKLDEWVGLPPESDFSSEMDVQKKLLQKIAIPKERYLAFNDQAEDPEKECQRIDKALDQSGAIDICILGIGQNGHIALNEPGEKLQVDSHVAELADKTLGSGMIEKVGVPLHFGMTLGMKSILDSKMILLFITGKGKKEAFEKLKKKEINPNLPASFLWLHPNAHVLVDKTSV